MDDTGKNGIDRRAFVGIGIGGAGLLAAGEPLLAQTAAGPVAPNAKSGNWPDEKLGLPDMPSNVDYAALREQRMRQISPDLRALYEQSSSRSLRAIGPERIRAAQKRPEAAIMAPGVTAYNIEIPGPAGPIPTRIYMPENAKGPLGVYVSTHGGGWMFGEGLTHIDAGESQRVLDWGCALVHPDFRVAPEHKFPAAIEDCYAALRYVGQHGAKHGFDTNRIGIGGGCTGANLATVVSLMARDAGDKLPAVQFLWSPSFDTRNNYQSHIEFAKGYGLSLDDADYVTHAYLRTREDTWDWRASPVLTPSLKGSPPALIWVGEWEILRGEAELYANRLRETGIPVHYIQGPQQGHGFIYSTDPKTHGPTAYAKNIGQPQINAIMRSYIGPEATKAKRKPARS